MAFELTILMKLLAGTFLTFLRCSRIFESPWFLSHRRPDFKTGPWGNWLGVLLSNDSEMHVISLLSYQIILDFFLIFHDFPDDYSCLFSNGPFGVITYFHMSAHFFTPIKFHGPRLLKSDQQVRRVSSPQNPNGPFCTPELDTVHIKPIELKL